MLKIYMANVSAVDIEGVYPLSGYRRERAGRLRDIGKKRESIGAELLLNHAVSECFPETPLPLDIVCSECGKPEVSDCGFCFSLSHSAGRALCAVSGGRVGADIQHISEFHDSIARRFFAAEEREYILSQPDRNIAFTEIWCKKESYIKFLGTGLATALDSFSVIGMDGIHYTVRGKYHIAVCTGDCITSPINITEVYL